MMKMFDKQKDGKLTFDEFTALYQYLTSQEDLFKKKIDTKSAGAVDKNEVNQALQQYGFNLQSNQFNTIFSTFDESKSGSLKLDEFIQLCLFLGNAKNIFTYLDSDRDGKITLSWDDFAQWTSYF